MCSLFVNNIVWHEKTRSDDVNTYVCINDVKSASEDHVTVISADYYEN